MLLGIALILSFNIGEHTSWIDELNARRAEGTYCGSTYMAPAQPVQSDGVLAISAALHSWNMAENNFFEHVDPSRK